ncbi:ECF transporter S component [Agromyces sp. SYSU T00194]|uniref:ECF transporter S component n=1 Tax=Agromyces chitinivorans TaxID=3158560 RepID=UPI0033949BA6
MRFTTRLLMTCAAIGAAGGLLLIPVNNAAAALAKVVPLAYAAGVGLYLLPFVIALALLRRPGVGVLTALIAGLVNVPFTPYGFSAVVTCVMIGVALEIPFLLSLYRYWRPWVFYVGAGAFAALYSTVSLRSLGVIDFAPAVQVVFVALLVASAVAGTWLGRLIAGRLERTGVVRGLARPAPQRTPVEASVDATA